MTLGVIAMVAAMSFTPRDKITAGKVGWPDQGVTRTAKATGVSQTVMTRAFLVMEYASDLAQPVIDGELQLNAAYGTASAPCSTPALVISVSPMAPDMSVVCFRGSASKMTPNQLMLASCKGSLLEPLATAIGRRTRAFGRRCGSHYVRDIWRRGGQPSPLRIFVQMRRWRDRKRPPMAEQSKASDAGSGTNCTVPNAPLA